MMFSTGLEVEKWCVRVLYVLPAGGKSCFTWDCAEKDREDSCTFERARSSHVRVAT
jgi:hypothetical protein